MFSSLLALRLTLLSSAENPQVLCFIKLLYSFIAVQHGKIKEVSSYADQLNSWLHTISDSYLDKFDLDAYPYQEAIKIIKTGKDKKGEIKEHLESICSDLMRAASGTSALRQIATDQTISKEEETTIRVGVNALKNPDNSGKVAKAFARVSLVNDPKISRLFLIDTSSEEESQKDLEPQMRELVKSVLGLDIPRISRAQAQEFKEKDPKAFETHKKLLAKSNAIYKAALTNVVRSAGTDHGLLTIKDVRKKLEKIGVTLTLIPDEMPEDAMINAEGKFFTPTGKELKAVPPWNAKINVTKGYDPEKDNSSYFSYQGPDDKVKQHNYSLEYRNRKQEERVSGIRSLESVDQDSKIKESTLNSARNRWIRWLKDKNSDRETKLKAALLEMLYSFAIRVGSKPGKSQGESTYGLSDLLVKHFKKKGEGLELDFVAKGGTRQILSIERKDSPANKALISFIKELMAGKDKNDKLWTYERGRVVEYSVIRRWVKELLPGASPKDFRTLKGAHVMQEFYRNNPLEKDVSLKEIDEYVKEGALEVGRALGHKKKNAEFTYTTAAKYYIPKDLLRQPFIERGFGARIPKWVNAS